MKKNLKKMIVMLSIVLGFTLSASAIIYGWGWVPGSLFEAYSLQCRGIPHAKVIVKETKYINDELCYYATCACELGYVGSFDSGHCIPAPEE